MNFQAMLFFYCTITQRVLNINFLGITIGEKLCWKEHVDNICKVISRNIGIINKDKFYSPTIIKPVFNVDPPTLKLRNYSMGQLCWLSLK